MKPILFNTKMVRAILDGRKTTTRRVIKPKCKQNFIGTDFRGCPMECRLIDIETQEIIQQPKPPYQPGDVLYIRETWSKDKNEELVYRTNYGTTEDDSFPPSMFRWRPSIHMPKEAARLFLRVTGVKAERLQDITENGAKAEGMVYTDFGMYQPSWKASVDGGKTFYPAKEQHHFGWNSGSAKGPGECFPTSRGAFAHLWDSTVNKSDLDHYGWSANPWVWVISFERTARPDEK